MMAASAAESPPETHFASVAALFFAHAAEPFGVLIEGESGAGKSELLFDLITLGQLGLFDLKRVMLVADDRVVLRVEAGRLVARPPRRLRGLLELRGLGLLQLDVWEQVAIGLRLPLVEAVERLPQPRNLLTSLAGVDLPTLALAPGPRRARLAVLAAHALSRGLPLRRFGDGGVEFPF